MVKKAPPPKVPKDDSEQEDSWEEDERVSYTKRKYTYSLLNPANIKLKQYTKLHAGSVMMTQRKQVVSPSEGARAVHSRQSSDRRANDVTIKHYKPKQNDITQPLRSIDVEKQCK